MEQLKSDLEANLVSSGLRKEVVDQLISSYFDNERLLKVFKFKAILNPRFLCKKTGKKFCFYIVDARYGRYLPLRAMTRKWEGDLSMYVIYGPQDTILRLHGTKDESIMVFEELKGANYDLEIVEVEDIPYFYRHHVVAPEETHVPQSVVRKLVLNYHAKDVPDQIRKDLMAKNVFLGVAIAEDLSITNRIKAFVGITLVGIVPYDFQRKFLDHLLSVETLKQRLYSVYKCKAPPYNYFLEVIVNDPVELDEITDSIAEILRGHIETSTFIVAKATERLPIYSKEDSLNLRGIPYKDYINYLQDVESRFVSYLSRDEINSYSKLSPREGTF
jgi:DNA-binding Lrp family transcriptional regulator